MCVSVCRYVNASAHGVQRGQLIFLRGEKGSSELPSVCVCWELSHDPMEAHHELLTIELSILIQKKKINFKKSLLFRIG